MNMLRNRSTPTSASSNGSNLSASYGGFDPASPSSYGGYSGGGAGTNGNGGGGGYSYGYGNGSSMPHSPMAASPMSSSTSSSPRVSKRRGSHRGGEVTLPSFLHNPMLALALLASTVLFSGTTIYYRSSTNSALAKLEENMKTLKGTREDVTFHRAHAEQVQRDLQNARGVIQKSQTEVKSLTQERDNLKHALEGPERKAMESRMVEREEAWIEQVHLLQDATRKESKRTVLERFGPGPTYKVRMWYVLPGDTVQHDFVIETAPLDLVPHAIHLFLEQVEHGLWNDCYFYLNGPHVLQAGPQAPEEEYDEDNADAEDRAVKRFSDKDLETLAFPDYNPQFPHVTWSVGFTGRPGGPDMYINKVDNVRAHGPGGQSQHTLEEQGDPCFGRITEGQNNVARLYQQQVFGDGSDWTWFLSQPVKITRAYVERPPERPQNEPQTQQQNNEKRPSEGHVMQRKGQQEDLINNNNTVKMIHDKLKRKPRLPDHQVDP